MFREDFLSSAIEQERFPAQLTDFAFSINYPVICDVFLINDSVF